MSQSFLESISEALKRMEKKFIRLSNRTMDDVPPSNVERYQERPFAYEFYHQFRKLIEADKVPFLEYFIQPEVNKTY